MRTMIFRTDASTGIGHGHVMRCLTLASALRERGAEVSFVCRNHDGHLCDLIEERGFVVSRLPVPKAGLQAEDAPAHAAWLGSSEQEDAEQTHAVIEASGAKPHWLVVDHYAIGRRWESALRTSAERIMVIDDLADRLHDCDLLLDQNLVAQMHTRYADKVPVGCHMLLGPEYALLQPIYTELHDRMPPREGPIRRILIFFGGTDCDNLTGRTLAAFLRLNRPDIDVDVIITASYPHAAAIRQQVAGHANIHVHSSLPTLAPLIAKANLAVGAGGATSWERLCLGLPTLVVTLAENQRSIADGLSQRGLIRWLGHGHEVSESTITRALGQVIDEGLDRTWSLRCLEAVDANGVNRVCAALTITATTSMHVRPARPDDEALSLEWANDPMSRWVRRSPKRITASTHRTWFYNRLQDVDNCCLYIVETTDGVVLGGVGLERQGDAWEIHDAVASVSRGRGLGRAVLEAALLQWRSDMHGALTFAQAKDRNDPESSATGAPPGPERGPWRISICSDACSWINPSIPLLLLGWFAEGHRVTWVHDAAALPAGDICFYLSYSRIVDTTILARH